MERSLKNRVLSIVIVVVLILSFGATNVYGFTQMESFDGILEDLRFDDDIVTDVDLEQKRLLNEIKAMGNIDIYNISGQVISTNPFTVQVDFEIWGKTMWQEDTVISYAQIANPTWENYDSSTGFYKSTPSELSSISRNPNGNIAIFKGYNENVKKYLELNSALNKTYGSNSYNAKYSTSGYKLLEVKDRGWYVGETRISNGVETPIGRGAYASKKDIAESIYADGIFLPNGKLNGFAYVDLGSIGNITANLGVQITSNRSFYPGIYHNGNFIEDSFGFYGFPKDPSWLRLYVDNPGVGYTEFKAPYYQEVWNGGTELVVPEPTIQLSNFKAGKTISKNGTYYFPMREVIEYYGHTVNWAPETGVDISGYLYLSSGSNIIKNTRNNTEIKLDNNIVTIDGVTYVPIEFLTKVFPENGFKWTTKDRGNGCISIDITLSVAG